MSTLFAERSIVTKMRLRAGREHLKKVKLFASSDLDETGHLTDRTNESELITAGMAVVLLLEAGWLLGRRS